MDLDIRLPLGLLFTAIGLVLIVAGFGPVSLSAALVSNRVDLIWGAALLGFGGVMAGLSVLGRRRGPTSSISPDADAPGGDLPLT